MNALYDDIGREYQARRRADPRIFALLQAQLGTAETVLNIGAGTGSYEPLDRPVVAVEPSSVMIAQRAEPTAAVVQAIAEALPFADKAFDLAMAVLTVHHWTDWEQGLKEAARVAGGNVLLLTWVGLRQDFWLVDYFPQIARLDQARFPAVEEYQRVLGPIESTVVPIPHDCTDGFMCAYWRRPEAYLDANVRNSISTFSMMQDLTPALNRLEHDLVSGKWQAQYGELLSLDSFDHGYRIFRSFGKTEKGGRPCHH
jgi:SAM-dependent methyltransferase